MTILILGVVLWWAAHLFKRLAPGLRGKLPAGGPDRGIMALTIVGSVILMIVGYKISGFAPVYEPPSWAKPVNNVLMIVAVLLIGMSPSKGRLGSMFRHPMLLGFCVWAAAHLLANGDIASLVLFDGPWEKPEPSDARGDVKLLIITAVVFTVMSVVHVLLGPSPFGA